MALTRVRVASSHWQEHGTHRSVCVCVVWCVCTYTREITSAVVSVDHDVPFIQAPINDLQMYLTSLKAARWFTEPLSTSRESLFVDRAMMVWPEIVARMQILLYFKSLPARCKHALEMNICSYSLIRNEVASC